MSDNSDRNETTNREMIGELRKVLKRLHYPLLARSDAGVCALVRGLPAELWQNPKSTASGRNEARTRCLRRPLHCAPLSLKILPVLVLIFRSRKRPVGTSWRLDETYIKVASQWKYLNHIVAQDHRAVKRMTDPMHMVKKGQLYCPGRQAMPSANQFYSLAGQAGLNVLNLLPTPPRTRRSGAPTTAHTRRLGPAVAHGCLLRRCARRPAR